MVLTLARALLLGVKTLVLDVIALELSIFLALELHLVETVEFCL